MRTLFLALAALFSLSLVACSTEQGPKQPTEQPTSSIALPAPLPGEIRSDALIDSSLSFDPVGIHCGAQSPEIELKLNGKVRGFHDDEITTVVDNEKITITWGKNRGEHVVIVNGGGFGYVSSNHPTAILKPAAWGGAIKRVVACGDPV